MSSPKASSGSSVIKPVDEMCFNDLGSKMERMSIPPLPTVYPKDPAVCFFFNDYVLGKLFPNIFCYHFYEGSPGARGQNIYGELACDIDVMRYDWRTNLIKFHDANTLF